MDSSYPYAVMYFHLTVLGWVSLNPDFAMHVVIYSTAPMPVRFIFCLHSSEMRTLLSLLTYMSYLNNWADTTNLLLRFWAANIKHFNGQQISQRRPFPSVIIHQKGRSATRQVYHPANFIALRQPTPEISLTKYLADKQQTHKQ